MDKKINLNYMQNGHMLERNGYLMSVAAFNSKNDKTIHRIDFIRFVTQNLF